MLAGLGPLIPATTAVPKGELDYAPGSLPANVPTKIGHPFLLRLSIQLASVVPHGHRAEHFQNRHEPHPQGTIPVRLVLCHHKTPRRPAQTRNREHGEDYWLVSPKPKIAPVDRVLVRQPSRSRSVPACTLSVSPSSSSNHFPQSQPWSSICFRASPPWTSPTLVTWSHPDLDLAL